MESTRGSTGGPGGSDSTAGTGMQGHQKMNLNVGFVLQQLIAAGELQGQAY